MRPGERLAWQVLIALAFVVAMAYLYSTLDPSVVCSNTDPC